jgi:hypothetical protein
MRHTTLLLALAALAATSCSLQLDSQYGLRWERRLPVPKQESESRQILNETNFYGTNLGQDGNSQNTIGQSMTYPISLELDSEVTSHPADHFDPYKPEPQPLRSIELDAETSLLNIQAIELQNIDNQKINYGPEYYWGFKILVFLASVIAMLGAILLIIGWAISEYATLYGGILLGIGGLGLIALGIWWLLYS